MKSGYFSIVSLLLFTTCTPGDNLGTIDNPNVDNCNHYIKLVTQNGTAYEPFLVNDSMIHMAVGSNVDLRSLKL